MMKQPFATADLKAELARALGFPLARLERLDGASALNFRAVRAGDGFAFLVKCSPPERRAVHERLVRHLGELAGSRAVVRRLFADVAPAAFRGYDVVCLAWCAGERRLPDELSAGEMRTFARDYLNFSDAMQRATLVVPEASAVDLRAVALLLCRGWRGALLRRLIERELPPAEATYRRDRLRVVHGDFHHGNFLFENGRVSGFFDLEEFCDGYPADDFVRYFTCAAEHVSWLDRRRRRRLAASLAEAVRTLNWPLEEWLVAINTQFLRRVAMKGVPRGIGFWRALNLCFRYRFYRRLKSVARGVLAPEGGVAC